MSASFSRSHCSPVFLQSSSASSLQRARGTGQESWQRQHQHHEARVLQSWGSGHGSQHQIRGSTPTFFSIFSFFLILKRCCSYLYDLRANIGLLFVPNGIAIKQLLRQLPDNFWPKLDALNMWKETPWLVQGIHIFCQSQMCQCNTSQWRRNVRRERFWVI